MHLIELKKLRQYNYTILDSKAIYRKVENMRHYRKRPFTKRVLTCIRKSSLIEHMGECSHIVVDSNILYWRLNCTPQQLARAIYALRKQGKLAKWGGNHYGFYELQLTLGERGIQQAWFTGITQELEDRRAAQEVDRLLKVKQRTENGNGNL
jgi:hypothetical protein